MISYPPSSKLLATHPGTRSDEAKLHARFAVHRARGREWYAHVPALLDHIAGVTREHGHPEPHHFAARPITSTAHTPTQPVKVRRRTRH